MRLSELLAGVALRETLAPEIASVEVTGLEYDSRRVQKGFVFFAFAGSRVDGRRFAQQALDQGALAVVSDSPRPAEFAGASSEWIHVEHGRHALAAAARNFYHHPDQRIQFTGITGTNGKTTTAYLIEAILRETGRITGLLGTIEYRLAGEVLPSPNTTPESLDIMRFAAELESRGGTHLIAEISSHALALGRVHGFHFHTAVFTNLTRDHLDFHGTMEEYGAAKRRLFADTPGPKWAVLNADDPVAKSMQPDDPSSRVIWYGVAKQATLRAENIVSDFEGLRFEATWDGRRASIASPLLGRVNVSNILAAIGASLSYGIELDAIAAAIPACRAVPGRFEPVDQRTTLSGGRGLRAYRRRAAQCDPIRPQLVEGPGDHALRLRWRSRPHQASSHGDGGSRSERLCGAHVGQSALGRSPGDHERRHGGTAALRYAARR